MIANGNRDTRICTVNLDDRLVAGLEDNHIATTHCADLNAAITGVRTKTCRLIVLKQPEFWSLFRTSVQVLDAVGDRAAIALAPHGAMFTPGLVVVDDQITAPRLAALIERLAG